MKKKYFYPKRRAHISIQFRVERNGDVMMYLTTNENKESWMGSGWSWGRSIANNEKGLLEEQDIKMLRDFCEAFLDEAKKLTTNPL